MNLSRNRNKSKGVFRSQIAGDSVHLLRLQHRDCDVSQRSDTFSWRETTKELVRENPKWKHWIPSVPGKYQCKLTGRRLKWAADRTQSDPTWSIHMEELVRHVASQCHVKTINRQADEGV